jgi:L-fuconolactonase
MVLPAPPSQQWLDLVVEDVVDPDVRIVDPHHHLWPADGVIAYGVNELRADIDGHRVEHTVFVECHASYRAEGPEHLWPVGETEFVAQQAAASGGLIAGIVARADLRRADLDDVLNAHHAASGGLLRGIRHALARSEHPDLTVTAGRAPKDLVADPAFLAGVARLGERGLTYDSWHFHYQNREMLALAQAVPGTTMVLDHFGTPLGIGPYEPHRDEIFQQWKVDIADLARCPNVVAKLGGMAMIDNGYGWHRADRPPTSDEFIAAQRAHYLHTIECFGSNRCMFESNFPMDRWSLSYRVLWNAFKKLIADFTADERDAMLRGTATRVYRLPD